MKILLEKKLANGLSFTVTEHSRVIAADRWYVKVVGVISLPLTDAAVAAIVDDEPLLQSRVRRYLGETVEHQLVKDRNFVDDAAKDEVVKELVAQLLETVSAYLEVEAFPARLLASKYREAREICRVEMGREESVSVDADEPDDFSHCFN